MNKALLSSKRMDWGTPQEFYDKLNAEFGFDLDAAATPENAKCAKYYTPETNGLAQNWGGHIVFCNPPYGPEIHKWVKKAHDESRKPGTTVVLLIPARTDTRYFHDWILGKAEIRYIQGRLKFEDGTEKRNSAPFPSMLVIYRSKEVTNG